MEIRNTHLGGSAARGVARGLEGVTVIARNLTISRDLPETQVVEGGSGVLTAVDGGTDPLLPGSSRPWQHKQSFRDARGKTSCGGGRTQGRTRVGQDALDQLHALLVDGAVLQHLAEALRGGVAGGPVAEDAAEDGGSALLRGARSGARGPAGAPAAAQGERGGRSGGAGAAVAQEGHHRRRGLPAQQRHGRSGRPSPSDGVAQPFGHFRRSLSVCYERSETVRQLQGSQLKI